VKARPTHSLRAVGRRQSGFTLLNVLVAALLFGLGMLGVARSFGGVTAAATQNENVTTLAPLSNTFWSAIQANSAVLTTSSWSTGATYNSSTYTTAPAAVQPFLKQVVTLLPSGTATIQTGPDSASGAACAVLTGCTVTLTISWAQVGTVRSTSSSTRSQTFLYRYSQS
jgi:Tfp pilus assembly protein PilV